MCMGMRKSNPVVREDPSIKFVDGNIMEPKDSPPEIDTSPVKKTKKVKNNVTAQSSGLNITTNY
ncbi:hypothetical protein Hroenn_gp14 [Pelagibacter phage Hroenn EXVC015P]|nr:hypothetical protein Bylgja_gp52 [Pelagibacter phage Bylgja EXVC010P]QLF88346.1 hypothetical protein Himinglaeva_gp52 [Pelagibacter phage Himinglaeva EXVC011P]QLF88359.1 hypothetical protein Hroenn_gp14 [Pelagibacter phage Hroenn EXVC015P]QLF88594.1 hypothetical protein Unn_gp36 [Pelagibacter phage Unn EXVC019P]